MAVSQTIGNNIKRARIKSEMSQTDFAAKLGFSLRTLQRIEGGRYSLSDDQLRLIAEAQGKAVDWYRVDRGKSRGRVRYRYG